MIKIMLLGKNGQVGWELQRALAPLGAVAVLGSKELNLENEKAIREAVGIIKPQVIVNAAAYNGVDQAEDEPQKAELINAIAPGILAEEAKRLNALLVHYSTDYVFDGKKTTPYTEEDQANPINKYGLTKLEGEKNIRDVGVSHLILRPCWIYGARGKNFFLTMLKLGLEKDELRVVDDQVGSPTWCRMIAEVTALILVKILNSRDSFSGTYHLSSSGETSWYGFARSIFDLDFSPGDNYARLLPISTKDFKSQAKRPAYSVLSCDKLQNHFHISLPHWEHSLKLFREGF